MRKLQEQELQRLIANYPKQQLSSILAHNSQMDHTQSIAINTKTSFPQMDLESELNQASPFTMRASQYQMMMQAMQSKIGAR